MTTKKKILKGSGVTNDTPRSPKRHRTIPKEKTIHRIINTDKKIHKNDTPFINPFYYQVPIIKKNMSFDTAPYDAINDYINQHPDKNITYDKIANIINHTAKESKSDDKNEVKKDSIDSELLLRICDF